MNPLNIMRKPGLLCRVILSILFGFAVGAQATAAETAGLKVLTEESPPLNFIRDGQVTGLATEVVRELGKRTGSAASIRLVPWQEGYQALLEQPDVALFSTVMTAERKPLFTWVGPLAALDTNLYARKGAAIRIANLDDARKLGKIATVAKYYSEQILEKEGFANTQSYPNREATVRELLEGKVQLLASSNLGMPAALKKMGGSMEDVESVFTLSTDLFYIAFSKATSPERVARWQDALDEMKRDGSFAKIYARWLPAEIPPGIFQLVTEEYPPVTFMKDGRPSGFVTDMVREIAARQKIPDNIRLTSWKNAYNMALVHPKVVLFSAERTPERESLFQWVGPVGKNSAILYAKRGSGIRINSLEEAKAISAIATTTNWFTEQHLKREGFKNLLSSPDPRTNIRQLMNGETQLSIFTDITIQELVREAGYSMDDLEPVFTVIQTDFYIALSSDTPADVVQAWQTTLDSLKKDGSFEKIYRRYLPNADLGDLLKK
ncbi:MAG: substrate-binding periplasmic protein [Thiobacillus sp.]